MSKELLINALKACDGSQSELARQLGVSRQLIALWVKRKKAPAWRHVGLAAVSLKFIRRRKK